MTSTRRTSATRRTSSILGGLGFLAVVVGIVALLSGAVYTHDVGLNRMVRVYEGGRALLFATIMVVGLILLVVAALVSRRADN